MNNYTPLLDKVITIKNVVSPLFLDKFANLLFKADSFSMRMPEKAPYKDRFFKTFIYPNNIQNPILDVLLGMSYSIALNVYEKGGSNYFSLNDIPPCSVSIKDKLHTGFPHTDPGPLDKNLKYLKILGILNPNWDPQWGGNFVWDEKVYPILPGDFLIFDPQVIHYAQDIFVDERRMAIDFDIYF